MHTSKANKGSRDLGIGLQRGSQGSQKGSQGTANLLVGPYHLPQGFHLCVCGLWVPVATHPPHLEQMALSLGMAIGTGRGQTDHVWSDQLLPPWLGLGPSTITACVQAEPEYSNNGQGHPCCGLPHPWPSSRARLTLQGERNRGVALRAGRWAPAPGSSCTAHLCLPSSLPAAPSLLWSEGVTQLSSRRVL